MQTDYFAILGLRPGHYSIEAIDQQYRSIRQEITRSGGPARQRRLDDALIARGVLRSRPRQSELLERHKADLAARAHRRPTGTVSRRTRGVRPTSTVSPISSTQPANGSCHALFAQLVQAEIESGLLRFTARQRLLLAANSLGVGQFKANLIIAEILHDGRVGGASTGRGISDTRTAPVRQSFRHRYGLRIAMAIAAAAVADLLVIIWLI